MMPVAYGSTEQYYPQMMGHPRPPAELSPLPTISGGYDVLPKLMKRGGGGANAPNQGATMQGIKGMMSQLHAQMQANLHPYEGPGSSSPYSCGDPNSPPPWRRRRERHGGREWGGAAQPQA